MISVPDAILTTFFAFAAGVSVVAMLPSAQMVQRPQVEAPYMGRTPQQIVSQEYFVPFDPPTDRQRLGIAQENLETQAIRIRKIEDSLDELLKSKEGGNVQGSRSERQRR